MLDECRQDNKYLIQKVDEAGHGRSAPKLAKQASAFLDAMKNLQKMLKENRTDKVKEAKQRFEVCQRLLEQGIRQSNRAEADAEQREERSENSNSSRVERYKQQNLQLLALVDKLKEQQSLSLARAPTRPLTFKMNAVDMQVGSNGRISDTEAIEIKLDRLQQVLKNKSVQLQN